MHHVTQTFDNLLFTAQIYSFGVLQRSGMRVHGCGAQQSLALNENIEAVDVTIIKT